MMLLKQLLSVILITGLAASRPRSTPGPMIDTSSGRVST